MKIIKTHNNKNKKLMYNITAKGSLGLLAYGDIGLRAWRKVKRAITKNES